MTSQFFTTNDDTATNIQAQPDDLNEMDENVQFRQSELGGFSENVNKRGATFAKKAGDAIEEPTKGGTASVQVQNTVGARHGKEKLTLADTKITCGHETWHVRGSGSGPSSHPSEAISGMQWTTFANVKNYNSSQNIDICVHNARAGAVELCRVQADGSL